MKSKAKKEKKKRYYASIFINGDLFKIGYFNSREEAEAAYKDIMKEVHLDIVVC